jgi:hypothetical protein
VRFRPAQIHPQDHLGPVLRFRSAGTGLDFEIRITRIHLTREHPSELEACNPALEGGDIAFDFGNRFGIFLLHGESEEFARVGEAARYLVEADDNLLEPCTLLAERLRALGFVPDVGLLEFALDFGQAFRFTIVVKDTSSTHRHVRLGRLSIV